MAEENIQTNAPEQDLSEILKVRREKLAALRAEGRDPGIPVAKDLNLEKRYHGIDTDVCLDVEGRDGSNVAVEHEWGAWNVQRRHWVEGHHVMRDAARMNGGV